MTLRTAAGRSAALIFFFSFLNCTWSCREGGGGAPGPAAKAACARGELSTSPGKLERAAGGCHVSHPGGKETVAAAERARPTGMSQAVRLLSFTAAIMCRSKIYQAGKAGGVEGEKNHLLRTGVKITAETGLAFPAGVGGGVCGQRRPGGAPSAPQGMGGAAPADRAARQSGGGRRSLESSFPSPAVRTLLSSPLFTRRSGWFVRQQQEEASQGQLSKSLPHSPPLLFLLLLPV